ncbi:S-adenosylmethionine decarboxylase [Aestuariivivens sediminis]|uniref:S-adenosylmethionine decarboxylase n=1 Tax=Aestuariivivens sediminis TaxID=2913557 RepID=UPI001F5A5EB7|nr:S-adenosylmethionine decarboxylase [Aestuariivivens sediminis]
MKNLAPDIKRQRLLIEGFYSIEVNESVIKRYFNEITHHLYLRIYGDPIIFSPSSFDGKKGNQGYDAFVPLIDSGISLYVWSPSKFLSLIIYTCKNFDEKEAIEFTNKFWKINEVEMMSF